MSTDKPFAPSCERNREPILEVLRERFAHSTSVLEVGSGTGQHAVYFAAALPHLRWQCSERSEGLAGIRLWLGEASLSNTPAPIALNVAEDHWPADSFDAAFSANTLHIMSWPEVIALFGGLRTALTSRARLVIYGPFLRNGKFSGESDARFDAELRAQSSSMGLRDISAVDALANAAGLHSLQVIEMPSNNLCLCWHRDAI